MQPTLPDDMDILAVGLVGSSLYGLAGPDSDEDWKGFYRAPIRDVLSTAPVAASRTWAAPDPDCTLFEVGRLFESLIKGDPMATELLFLPEWLRLTEAGKLVLQNRDLFLSERLRNTYGGFGKSQSKKVATNARRREKSVRHMFRVAEQGIALLTTGTMSPVLADPERILALGRMSDEEIAPLAAETFERLRTCECVLPAKPNLKAINNLLADIRLAVLL